MTLVLALMTAFLVYAYTLAYAHTEPAPERTPASFSLLTYLWVVGLAIWGGIVSYVQRVRAGHSSKFSITEAIGEVVTSGFVGIMTFWLCESMGVPQLMTAAFVGVSGHMGARGIRLLETVLERRFGLAPTAPSEVPNDQRDPAQN